MQAHTKLLFPDCLPRTCVHLGLDIQCCAFCHMECLFHHAARQGSVVPFYTCALTRLPKTLKTLDPRSGVVVGIPAPRMLNIPSPLVQEG